ncbi:unnamed protein product [Ceratitis capitata]|uniref:(Mediterranean fruit fly) hypothetical protein n=1 Tax=Ceratitis capitata TaxID=7213 RepID=A0A811UZR1_CERCA|nr:unnamed protein product [Ceratitis capitata]
MVLPGTTPRASPVPPHSFQSRPLSAPSVLLFRCLTGTLAEYLRNADNFLKSISELPYNLKKVLPTKFLQHLWAKGCWRGVVSLIKCLFPMCGFQ